MMESRFLTTELFCPFCGCHAEDSLLNAVRGVAMLAGVRQENLYVCMECGKQFELEEISDD